MWKTAKFWWMKSKKNKNGKIFHVHGWEKILSRCQFFPSWSTDSRQCQLKSQQLFFLNINKLILKFIWRDFPGSPVVNTSPSSAGGSGSIPGQGAKIPHASRPKNQNIKQKQYCNKYNKDFKNGPHQKKKILKIKKFF